MSVDAARTSACATLNVIAVFAVLILAAESGLAGQQDTASWNHPSCPCPTALRSGSAAAAGLVEAPLEKMDGTISRVLVRRVAPGAVVLIARRGTIAKWKAYGYAALYSNANYDLMAHPVDMQKNTIFDLASVTKLFTATAVMQLWDQGKFKLDDPVAKYLPKFGVNGKMDVTVRELLDHTSGFRGDPATPLYQVPGDRAARLRYVLSLPLEYPPNTHYVYSDTNFMTLGALIEHWSGEREDVYIHQHIAEPLHMSDTMYNPPASLKNRIEATEYQPWTKRGLLWGQVDDENAWALGGVAGHAGLFSSAHDLAVFGQMMLNDGTYDGQRILSRRAVKLLLTNWDKEFPDDATGLGWSIDRGYFMGALSGPDTLGHEGFTGTTIVLNKKQDIVALLLMNRVHPTRNGASDVVARRDVFTDLADAIPVAIPGGGEAWFSGYGDYLNRTLTAKVDASGKAKLSFQTWYRTEPDHDYGTVEVSSDAVYWKPIDQITGSSAGWRTETLKLPANTNYIQFRYRTDKQVNGRGWYLHNVAIKANGRTFHPQFDKTDWLRRSY
ncbi:MAG: serine hydrolase [Bryobacteraceae bacterium]